MSYSSNERIAVIVPCFNEEIAIGKVINDFKMALLTRDVEAGAAFIGGLVYELSVREPDQCPHDIDIPILAGQIQASQISWCSSHDQFSSSISHENRDQIYLAGDGSIK